MRLPLSIVCALFALATPAFAGALAGKMAAKGERALAGQDVAAAIDYCEQAIVADPADVRGFSCLARSYDAKEDKKLEAKYYRAALAIQPDNQDWLTATVRAEADSGEIEDARASLVKLGELCDACPSWQRLQNYIDEAEARRQAEAVEKALPPEITAPDDSAP